ncbi:MAG: hypothetical protein WD512_04190 [Candidatus Paceibacterota bacterium]
MNTSRNKYGGRKKGTPNKLTSELRHVLKDIVSNELNELSTNLKALEAKERIEILIKLLPYALPKEIEQMNIDYEIEPVQFQVISPMFGNNPLNEI